MTHLPKKVKFIVTIFSLILIVFSFVSITEAQILDDIISEEVKDVIFTPQIGIGKDFQVGTEIKISGRTFTNYIITVYNWALRALVILAITMIMVGGISWMSAAGNAAIVTGAKKKITSALVGLLIGISSYTLLTFINPELVQPVDLDDYELSRDIETTQFTVGTEVRAQCGGPLGLLPIAIGQENTAVTQDWYIQDEVYKITTNGCFPDLADCNEKFIDIPKNVPNLKMSDIKFIAARMGVDSNAALFCDLKSLDKVRIQNMTPENKWFTAITDPVSFGGGGAGCGAVYIPLVGNYGAAIKIRACFGDVSKCSNLGYQAGPDGLLKGFSLTLTDQSLVGEGAFFYYDYIEIYTNICCGKDCPPIPD